MKSTAKKGNKDVARYRDLLERARQAREDGRHFDAERLQAQALRTMEKLFSPHNPFLGNHYARLAHYRCRLVTSTHREEEQEKWKKKAIHAQEKAVESLSMGMATDVLAHEQRTLAQFYALTGRFADSTRLYRDFIETVQRNPESLMQPYEIFRARWDIIHNLCAQGEVDEAALLMRKFFKSVPSHEIFEDRHDWAGLLLEASRLAVTIRGKMLDARRPALKTLYRPK